MEAQTQPDPDESTPKPGPGEGEQEKGKSRPAKEPPDVQPPRQWKTITDPPRA